MARKGWHEALAEALEKEGSLAMQLATIDSGEPRVRSHLMRAFITAPAYPALPLILTTTDIRSPKVLQLAANARVEGVFWLPRTLEQIRVRGRAWVVPRPGYTGAYPAPPPGSVVYEALCQAGFDWEAERVATFDRMSGRMKATWCRPVPGTPLPGGEDDMAGWPETLPERGDEAADEAARARLAVALGNCALVLVEVNEVDYLEFPREGGTKRDRRRRFERGWGEEVFRETWVVP